MRTLPRPTRKRSGAVPKPPIPAAAPRPVEVTVERIGIAGDGIAHWHDQTLYLPFTAPGDRVLAVPTAPRAKGCEGRVVGLIAAGTGRVAPCCHHFGVCGGCALQHLSPALYRETKLDGLRRALRRVGIDPQIVAPLRQVAVARRRVSLGLVHPRNRRQTGVIGFRERFRHNLVDIAECPVMEPALLALAMALRPLVPMLLPPGGRAEATLTRTDSGLDLLLTMPEEPPLPALEALVDFAHRHDLARIVWRSAAGDRPVIQRRPVRIVRAGIAIGFPPGAFIQPSETAEALLVDEVSAAVGGARPVLDLFAGLGTFGFALAASGPVHMVEGDPMAAAARAAAARGCAAATVERRDLARDPLPPEALAAYRAAVFDPPRAGAARQAEALARSTVATVVAVSCNPATFARDAATLIAGGFRIERLVAVDQFVWSPHLELIGVFRR